MHTVNTRYMLDFLIIGDNSKLCNWHLEIEAGSPDKGLEVKIWGFLQQGRSV